MWIVAYNINHLAKLGGRINLSIEQRTLRVRA